MRKKLPSKRILFECFQYREDGILIWKERPRSHFQSDATWNAFNKRMPGLVAGSRRGEGYLYVYVKGKPYSVHRIICAMHGIDISMDIDHIDQNKINNRVENLRPASKEKNMANRAMNKSNMAGIKGLSISGAKGGKKYWHTEIQINKNRHQRYFPYTEAGKQAAIDWLITTREALHKEFSNHGSGCVILQRT